MTKPGFVESDIIIDSPAESPSGEPTHPVGTDCTIDASGRVGEHVPGLSTLTSQVNSGPSQTKNFYGATSWSFSGLYGAHSGSGNMFRVSGFDYDGYQLTPAQRSFYGTGGSGCYPSTNGSVVSVPISTVMPRSYEIHGSAEFVSNDVGDSPSTMQKGESRPAPDQLIYDEALSTPSEPVWRSCDDGEVTHCWTLRLMGGGDALSAELVLQPLSLSSVEIPEIWLCRIWRFHTQNWFELISTGRTHGRFWSTLTVSPVRS